MTRDMLPRPKLTRRTFINMVGSGAGVGAAYATLQAMGLMAAPPAHAARMDLPAGSGQGREVVVLGAGMAGLVAAYELSRAGYSVKVLEASPMAGGRNRSYRAGDMIHEEDSTQVVGFTPGPENYFNAGPARLPYHHQAILSYCHEFGVALEPIVNDTRAAFFQDDAAFDGKPVRGRQVVNDSRGIISEMLAKAVNAGALDEELTDIDKETFLDFVSSFGNLGSDDTFAGTSRSGFSQPPGSNMNAPGAPLDPLSLSELLASDFWGYKMHFSEGFQQAATMLQPKGGMARIADAFVDRVGALIEYDAEVTRISREGEGARVVYIDASGTERSVTGDYVICTIPFSVLSGIEADFSADVSDAIAACNYVKAAKTAFESPRFWETGSQIYGGISWTSADITQMWYPSSGFGAPSGILVASYIWSNAIGERFGAMSQAERLEMVIDQASRVHPEIRDHVQAGATIAWEKVPFQKGGWASWSAEARADHYPAVTRPDGPYYFAGEHVSYLTGWQEGAVLSAQEAVARISERTLETDL